MNTDVALVNSFAHEIGGCEPVDPPLDPRRPSNEALLRDSIGKEHDRRESFASRNRFYSLVVRAIVEMINAAGVTQCMMERKLRIFMKGKKWDGTNLKTTKDLDFAASNVAEFCIQAYILLVQPRLGNPNDKGVKLWRHRFGKALLVKTAMMTWARPSSVNSLIIATLDNIKVPALSMPGKIENVLKRAANMQSFGISSSFMPAMPPICLDFLLLGAELVPHRAADCPKLHNCPNGVECELHNSHRLSQCPNTSFLSANSVRIIEECIAYNTANKSSSNSNSNTSRRSRRNNKGQKGAKRKGAGGN